MLTYVVTSLLAIAGNFLVILAILLRNRDAKNLNPISSFLSFSLFFFQQKCNMAHQMLWFLSSHVVVTHITHINQSVRLSVKVLSYHIFDAGRFVCHFVAIFCGFVNFRISAFFGPNLRSSPHFTIQLSLAFCDLSLGVGDACFFLTMRCFPILNDAIFCSMFFNF